MEPVPSSSWSREFNPGLISNWVLLGIPLSLVFGGVFFGDGWETQRPLLEVTGGLGAVLGPCISIRMWRTGETTRVVCGPVGFQTETLSRSKASRREAYRWGEVTATRYEVEKWDHHNKEADTYFRSFAVDTIQGQRFSFDDKFPDFAEVINLCNAMTAHLPCVWQPRLPGQDWEYLPPQPQCPLSGQAREVKGQANYVCSARLADPAAPPTPTNAPPPIPPAPAPFRPIPPPLPSMSITSHQPPPIPPGPGR